MQSGLNQAGMEPEDGPRGRTWSACALARWPPPVSDMRIMTRVTCRLLAACLRRLKGPNRQRRHPCAGAGPSWHIPRNQRVISCMEQCSSIIRHSQNLLTRQPEAAAALI